MKSCGQALEAEIDKGTQHVWHCGFIPVESVSDFDITETEGSEFVSFYAPTTAVTENY